MEQIRRILQLCRPYRWRLLLGFSMVIAIIALALIIPNYTEALIDDVIKGGRQDMLKDILLGMAGLSLLRMVLIFARTMLFEDTSQRVICEFRQALFEHLHELPYRFFSSNSIGEIMSRMTQDMDAVRHIICAGFTQLLENVLYFVGAFVFIAMRSWQLALAMMAVAPLVCYVGLKFDRTVRPMHRDIRDQNAVMNARAQENISGIRVVKAYAREPYEIDTFNGENHKHLNMGIRMTRTMGTFNPTLNFLGSVPQVAVIIAGGWMAAQGTLSTGAVVAVMGYIWMIVQPMRSLGDIINTLSNTIASTERLVYYMDLGTEIKDGPNPYEPKEGEFRGHVKFDHVSFRYENEPVLEDICFEVQPGKTLAIMGGTGTGKTSVVNLLSRFYDVTGGSVTIDGVDVRRYKLKALRKHIGHVMQEPFLFSQTIRNNIAFGRIDADDADVDAAAEASCTKEFVDTMADGYETIVGERGMGLSGGQKQRIAIARAIAYKPDILVLDDATSAVDMETELAIQQGLKKTLQEKTTFIVSHRISAVKDADEIIVLSGTRIAERGTHEELLAKKGLYWGIFMDQYRDFQSITQQGGELA